MASATPGEPDEAGTDVRVIILGDTAVGKTSMVRRYENGKVGMNFKHSLGVDFVRKRIETEGWLINATLWDTAGQERFDSTTSGFIRSADGAVIAYDITRAESLRRARLFRALVEELVPGCPVVLVGNKSDLTDVQVPTAEGEALRDELNCQAFFETSARTKKNLSAAFERVAVLAAGRVTAPGGPDRPFGAVDLETPAADTSSCC